MIQPLDILKLIVGVIQPKPLYRSHGKFRRETPQEFRARHDDKAWQMHLKRLSVVKNVSETNPYSGLMP